MEVVCLGLNHQTAHVDVREKYAIADHALPAVVEQIKTLPGIHESVIVSTCNRVEYYVAADQADHALQALGQHIAGTLDDATSFYRYGSTQSIRHLFRVVSGLDSMVLGETEILGQVKKAYQAAAGSGATAKHLNKLFQRAFHVAKEVRSRTKITQGPVSVGSVAVDLAAKIFGKLSACHVMILGAGEMSELTARALLSRGARSIFVANRSHDRAVVLAGKMGGSAIPFDAWEQHFQNIDILIGSTAAPHAILTREKLAPVMARRPDRPLFIIDLAVPRDIEPSVNTLDGVYLYDIDSLQAIAAQSMEIRRQELVVCETIIERHVTEFSQWLAGNL
ncbi:MAG: glutamyl-tRNA reductase [Chthoniobacteraceae bacterium]